MSLFNEPVVYVDIETTGGSATRNRVIEVAAIRVEDGVVTESFNTLVNPQTSVPYWITNLTGITENDVVQAPSFADITDQLNSILKGAIFIAHNVRFDYSFLKQEFANEGYNFKPKLLCTVRLSRALYPEHKGHGLQKLIERHNIIFEKRHRAYDDANAIKLFSELAYQQKGAEAFAGAIARQLKTQSLPPNLSETTMDAIDNKPGVYIFEDEAGKPLYVGKSVTIRKRLLSHFNQDIKDTKEMKLSRGVHNIKVVETETELEALLLESKMVKELLPIHNRQLRRVKSHFVLLKEQNQDGYNTIRIADMDLAKAASLDNIYGMYTNKSKAKTALEDKRKTFDLCPKLLGLEKASGACFMSQLGKCKGACAGREPAALHNARLELALMKSKVENWSHKTAVTIDDGSSSMVVVDKWIIEGYIELVEEGEPHFRPVERRFDLDTYRILRGYMKKNLANIAIRPITYDALQSLRASS